MVSLKYMEWLQIKPGKLDFGRRTPSSHNVPGLGRCYPHLTACPPSLSLSSFIPSPAADFFFFNLFIYLCSRLLKGASPPSLLPFPGDSTKPCSRPSFLLPPILCASHEKLETLELGSRKQFPFCFPVLHHYHSRLIPQPRSRLSSNPASSLCGLQGPSWWM